MKLHSFFVKNVTFLLFLCFFIIPPLFIRSSNSETFSIWNLPVKLIIYASVAVFLYYIQKKIFNKNEQKNIFWGIYATGSSLITFGELCTVAALLEFISYHFQISSTMTVTLPDKFYSYFFCSINLLCSSFYEEVVYRQCLPNTLRSIFTYKKNNQYICFIAEAIAIFLFAMAHRYLGFMAIINAAISGLFLRICFLKTHSIFPGTAAHFFYNLIMLFLFSTSKF
jgi:uncharacterized protein